MRGSVVAFICLSVWIFIAVPSWSQTTAPAEEHPSTAPAAASAKVPPKPQVTTSIINYGGEPKYDLKSRFLPGKYRIDMLNNSKIKQYLINESPSAEEPETLFREMETSTQMVILMAVSDFNDKGVKTIAIQYENIKMVDPMLGEIEMDQAKAREIVSAAQPEVDEASPDYMIRQLYANMVAGKIEFTVSRDGKVLNVKGVDEITTDIPGNESMKAMLNNLLGKLVSMLQSGIISMDDNIMPGKPVGIGGTWKIVRRIPMMGISPIDVVNTTIFESVKNTKGGKIAVLKSNIKSQKADDASGSTNNIKMTRIDSEIEGKTEFNLELGMISSLVQSGGMEMIVDAGQHGNVKIKQQMRNSINVKPVK